METIDLERSQSLKNTQGIKSLRDTLAILKKHKPDDRSELDRRYAVTITELEKTLAYFYTFVVSNEPG